MRADVGAVDHPEFSPFVFQHLMKLPVYKVHGVGQSGDVAAGLQIVKGQVVVDALRGCLFRIRHGGDPGVMVSLAAGDHGSVAVIRPHPDDLRIQIQKSLLVKLHHLPIEVGTENRVFHMLFYQLGLFSDYRADQGSPGLRCLKPAGTVAVPERAVPLSPKAQVPDHLLVLLFDYRILPEPGEEILVFQVVGLLVRVGSGEHLRSQRLRVVMGDPESHVG